jgi:agmatinase
MRTEPVRLLNAMPPYTLFGLEDTYADSKVVVLPVPYDSATTYKSGTRDGPHAIITASREIERFNEEIQRNIGEIGIYTMEELTPNLNSPEDTINDVEKETSLILEDGKMPLMLGGDHSLAIGTIRAVSKQYKGDFSVIHFDAHSDSRDTFFGSKYCHACVIARAREVCDSVYSVGIRSTEEEGYKKHRNSTIYRMDMHEKTTQEVVDFLVENTKQNVYITVDLDVLDPSEMPSLGTPEPDGLSYYELLSIIKGILAKKKLVGADFVELAPIPGMIAPDYLAAKLILMTIGYGVK